MCPTGPAPSSAPPLKKNNGLLPPKPPGPYDLYRVNEFNIEKKFKKQILLVSILKLMLFECLACNLLPISPLKLCFEKLRFLWLACSRASHILCNAKSVRVVKM
jgi:hypothetical protein